ncbi:transmembrane protein 120A [Thecamonas trahens ATCC 50062]|uniref:Transmembrane protein 120A n=1 Tax=Thecamonas trahens ATCC 50062 TaxID=461836 RepID=A0A0L0DDJ0_THETB|nr:transmembrane protein 120A [Thecamonas trahens ATCC 50062]KNC50285.1 transmembrane protein 120A [Thecamonas trahens ATCC 50062]|eukprot:XP_013757112.1 transmembrane protein 120A [Thecamonas trahens ATCC 50062]
MADDMVRAETELGMALEAYRASLREARDRQRRLEKALSNASFELTRAREGVAMGMGSTAEAETSTKVQREGNEQGSGAAEAARQSLDEAVARAKVVLPRPGALYFQLMVGSVNIRMIGEDERWTFKEEYEWFKNVAMQLSVFVTLLVYWVNRPWLDTLFHALVLYYYFSITLREHILLVNGSNIRRWWRRHHYITILLTAVLLTWPPKSDSWHLFRNTFTGFIIYIGCLQMLQYRYQRARLQVLRSLGQTEGTDVVNSDTTQMHWTSSMLFLLPFLFVGQFFQLYIGYFLIALFRTSPSIEWQVPVAGVLYIALGIGNLFTTLRVVYFRYAAATDSALLTPKLRSE